jgi:hypothetical protein
LRSSHSVARLNPPRCYPRREPLLLARLPERRGEDAGGAGALAQGETYRNRHDALFNRDKATAHSLGQPRALTRPDRLESARGRRTDEHPLADHHLCHHPAPITHHDSVSRKCASCALDLMDLVILFWSFPQQNDLRRPPAADEPSVDITCSFPGVCQPARSRRAAFGGSPLPLPSRIESPKAVAQRSIHSPIQSSNLASQGDPC